MYIFNSILLIEDDPIASFLERKIIESECHTKCLVIKSNGEKAISYIQEEIKNGSNCPELILLDLNLPGMDGFEFLEEFGKALCNVKTKIIIITNSSLLKDKAKASGADIDHYIEKPLTKEKFKDILQRIVA